MHRILKLLFLIVLFAGLSDAAAQHINNPLNYSHQATLIGQNQNSGDPASVILPGTSFYSGFGSFMDNPASMVFAGESYFQFGLSNRSVSEDATFLSQTRNSRRTDNGLTNAGFIYNYPTVRGSLVIGAGYNQLSNFNRVLDIRGHNSRTTITDAFKAEGSQYQEIAYNSYATDIGDDFGDWDESIFRIGFDDIGDFPGITQQGEIIERGATGEYSIFLATEFRERLMVGASLGIVSGTYRYDRLFQEIDEENIYDGEMIEGGTDIDRLTLDERLRTRFTGLRARAGLIYQFSDHVSAGASFTLPTLFEVDETYDIGITTLMDNGDSFGDETDSEFSYKVRYPSELSFGLGLYNYQGFSASVSADLTNYSNTEVDFLESDFYDDERAENDFLQDNFDKVWSFRGGVSYDIHDAFTLRGGYAWIPTRFINGDDNRNVYSLGAGFGLTPTITLDISAQYTVWDETSVVYEYAQYDYTTLPENPPTYLYHSEDVFRAVDKLNLLATIRFRM